MLLEFCHFHYLGVTFPQFSPLLRDSCLYLGSRIHDFFIITFNLDFDYHKHGLEGLPILPSEGAVSALEFPPAWLEILLQNSLDAGIQDSSTSISIVVKFEEMSELDGDESDKRI